MDSRYKPFFNFVPHTLTLAIKVKPNSKRSALCTALIVDEQAYMVISLAAPAHDNLANRKLIEFLATIFAVKRSQIEISSGVTCRFKCVKILNVSQQVTEPCEQYLRNFMP